MARSSPKNKVKTVAPQPIHPLFPTLHDSPPFPLCFHPCLNTITQKSPLSLVSTIDQCTLLPYNFFLGGNTLDKAPTGRVADFVKENGGHTVITKVSPFNAPQQGTLLTYAYIPDSHCKQWCALL